MAESSANHLSEKKPLAASGAEVIFLLLLVVLGIGLCGLVEKNFILFWPEPTEQRAFDTPRIKDKQEELTRLENSIKETERQIEIVAIDQLKQQAVQKSLQPPRSALIQGPQSATATSPTEADRNYQAARTQEQTTSAVQSALTDRLAALKPAAEKTSQDLKVEKQMASDKLASQRRDFLLMKFGAAILVPLAFVIVIFLFGAVVLRVFAGKPVWAFSGGLPVLFMSGVLLILLVYRVLEVAGAALIGIFVFLVLLRRIRWTPRLSGKGTG